MYDVIGHIFGGLDSHEKRLMALEQGTKKNPGAGWAIFGATIACAGVAFLADRCMKLQSKVTELEKDVAAQKEILANILVPETEDEEK